MLETGGVGNRIRQAATTPEGLVPDSYLVDTFGLTTTHIDTYFDEFLPEASPWLHQCSALYSGNEKRRNHNWKCLNLNPFSRWNKLEEKQPQVCVYSFVVKHLSEQSFPLIHQPHSPSPLSINIACLHLTLAPFDEASLLPSRGLTPSALLASLRLSILGRHSSDLGFDLLHHTEERSWAKWCAVCQVGVWLCLDGWMYKRSNDPPSNSILSGWWQMLDWVKNNLSLTWSNVLCPSSSFLISM